MKRTRTLFAIAAVSFLMALSSTAFAGIGIGSEAGIDVMPSATAIAAAQSHYYSHDQLQAFGTETGADVAASPKALAAATLYKYDQGQLAQVGRDASDVSYFAKEHQSEQVMNIVNNANKGDLICLTC